jgi:hypothetical protein
MSYSVDPRDWSLPGVQAIVDRVVGAATPGAVVDLHDGGGDRSETVAALPQIITDLEGEGYSFASVCGYLTSGLPQVSAAYGFGQAPAAGPPVVSAAQFSGAAADAATGGYWLCARDGAVFAFDGAPFAGSLPGLGVSPAQPVVGMAATPTGDGYWLVGADGGVFAFGDARYYGSMGGTSLQAPVVGMAATPTGDGYWLVGSDGGVFTFGDAGFAGSLDGGAGAPVVAMAADPATGGYWLLGSDGGVFSFAAPFLGSEGGQQAGERFFAVAATTGGAGYLLAAGTHAPT